MNVSKRIKYIVRINAIGWLCVFEVMYVDYKLYTFDYDDVYDALFGDYVMQHNMAMIWPWYV